MSKSINQYIDHTLLKATASKQDIIRLCEEAIKYDFKAVCVPPCFVYAAKGLLLNTDVLVATVIGFPLGYHHTKNKIDEATLAINDGADELDVVINISNIRSEDWLSVEEEITAITQHIHQHKKIIKLIVETAYISDEELEKVCKIALDHKVDFIKTSTGFAPSGADVDTIKKIKQLVGDNAQIKASGGISDYEKCMAMIEAGADRIGTSSGVRVVEEGIARQYG